MMYDTKVRSFLRPFFRVEVIRSTSEFNDGIYNRSSCASVRLRDRTKNLCRGYVLLGFVEKTTILCWRVSNRSKVVDKHDEVE